MIGVLAPKTQLEIAREFFELFKTPWEPHEPDKSYDVILCSSADLPRNHAKLLLIFSSEETLWDKDSGIHVAETRDSAVLKTAEYEMPIYGSVSRLIPAEKANKVEGSADSFIIKKKEKDRATVIRIGYNLLGEIEYILKNGQPNEYAHIPTIDLHIQLLRNWIIDAGLPLIEIPPVPYGYDFMCCLTHDVDFAGIRNHRFDRTMFGFLYRALLKSFFQFLKGQKSLKYLCTNWLAAVKLPLVYLGFADDFWMQFDNYRRHEDGLPSTFFFIPFANKPGNMGTGQAPESRGCKYQLEALQKEITKLKEAGCEIGLHGIDAWHSAEKANEERIRIKNFTDDENIGVRMHWLYFDKDSGKHLENAGLYYDSSLGYNDALGFRNGTTQPFKMRGTTNRLELPLNIQDTSMFYPDRMGLCETNAIALCKEIVKTNNRFGGTLTINWHHRSLAPERQWGNFYRLLIAEIKKYKVWFGSGANATCWYLQRRGIKFKNVRTFSEKIHIEFDGLSKQQHPQYQLKTYIPALKQFHSVPIHAEEGSQVKISLVN